MQVPTLPDNEADRLASLQRMQLLASPDEPCFDRITRIAQKLFKTPIVLISLVDTDQQWFKSCIGLTCRSTSRDISFCGHAILSDSLLVVPDALQDARFRDNPLVLGAPFIRFYAGCPLKNHEGYRIGTLCIIDDQPRQLTPDEYQSLQDLGAWVELAFLNRDLSGVQQSLIQELDQSKRLTQLDPLLNIWHREAILELLKRELSRAFHNKSRMAVALLDIDQFARVNQQVGHQASDLVLFDFVRRVKSCVRQFDTIGRYGNDEFLIILPDIEREGVCIRLSKLINEIRGAPFTSDATLIDLHASVGCVTIDYTLSTPNEQEVLAFLEQALSDAMATGGNKLIMRATENILQK
ncbi:diguanylate cyclase [Burkholderiaceae bacterium DAT-1]|nr:diguanylate cyclase [Burkholderiaceae bacterium DAT-1]